jgi:endonuclease-3 related protein
LPVTNALHERFTLDAMYETLLAAYGPQGWWPLLEVAGCNPTRTGRLTGYHPGVYDYPRTERQRFEICVGAVLTQNTAWSNVEKALVALAEKDALTPEAILAMADEALGAARRPSGYYHTKAKKLKHLAAFFAELDGRVPDREALLAVWGIGPETADSILLYAYGVPEVVVDAYTRRVFAHLGLVSARCGYDELKRFCAARLPAAVVVRQEFHALLVEHAKRCYAGRPPYRDVLFARAPGSA